MATPPTSTSTILPWDWRGGKYSPVPCTRDSAHKTFGSTDLTSTYSVCTRRIVRVHYFVRGGFVGHRSRASSKHLSSHLPVDRARFLGGQKGVALQLHVWVSGPQRSRPLSMLMFGEATLQLSPSLTELFR
ncbi:hypothetical protein TNCV_2858401 [Trichonephila clavipes]|nr:hypothetical protein TNCV_2858401 [Trichonephila clavipes]